MSTARIDEPFFVAVEPAGSVAAIAIGDESPRIVAVADLEEALRAVEGRVLVVHAVRTLAEVAHERSIACAWRVFEAAGYLRHLGFEDSEATGAALVGVKLEETRIANRLDVTRHLYAMACADATCPPSEFEIADRTARLNLRGVRVDGATATEFQSALISRRDREMREFVHEYRDFDCRLLEHDDEAERYVARRWPADDLGNCATDAQRFLAARNRLRTLRRALRRAERYIELSQNGTARHVLRYYGAHTGRFAARASEAGINLHQLWKEKPDLPELRFERRIVVPPNGSLFRAGDLASIEARIVAWLAQERSLLERFRSGEDVYAWFASQIVPGVAIAKRGPNAHLRALGKTCILGLGFGMGLEAFVARAEKEAPGCSRDQIERAYETYSSTFARTGQLRKSFWRALLRAFAGESVWLAPETWARRWDLGGSPSLTIELPTGRSLHFRGVVDGGGPIAPAGLRGLWYAPEYSGVVKHRTSHGRERARRFGDGRWRTPLSPHVVLENIAQAIARDIMIHQSLALETRGLTTAFHAHDELVVECLDCGCAEHDPSCAWTSAGRELLSVMNQVPTTLPRLAGLPLACELNDEVGRSYA